MMVQIIIVIYIIITCVLITSQAADSKPQCEPKGFIDISKGNKKDNGVIEFDGFQYNSGEYYTSNETVNGCICLKKVCIRKCCKSHTRFADKNIKIPCTPTNETLDFIKVFHFCGIDFKWKYAERYNNAFCGSTKEPSDYSLELPPKVVVSEKVENIFHVKDSWILSCPPGYTVTWGLLENNNEVGLIANGQLWFKHADNTIEYLNPDQYCFDSFVQRDENGVNRSQLNALVCYKNQDKDYFIASCMLISCFFMVLTLAVYAWLPELRNLHGKVVMGYLIGFLVTFILMATLQIIYNVNQDLLNLPVCKFFTFFPYYSLVAAFFWMNVMCFDIYYTFCGYRGVSMERTSTQRRFRIYCIYALGMPLVLTLLLVILEHIKRNFHFPYLPILDENTCFLGAQDKMIYLYGPMGILIVVNLVFFLLTTKKIMAINRDTDASINKNKESATNDRHRSEKQRFILYFKLFCVMGLNWSFEIIGFFLSKSSNGYFFKFTDTYNALTGVIFFIIFVCKKKIFRLIKIRYHQARGLSDVSRTQTSSTRTLGSRDEVRMSFIQNNLIGKTN